MSADPEGTVSREDAPAADAAHKVASPTDLTGPAWRRALIRSLKQFQRNQLTDQAAALTYFSVLSLFPALIALVALLGVVGDPVTTTNAMLDLVTQLGQADTANQLRAPVEQMTQASGAGLTLLLSVLTGIWSASGYIGAFGRAMNRIYGVHEGRPIWTLKPLQLVLTLVAIVLAATILLGLVVTGEISRAIGDVIGLGQATVTTWDYVKWPVMLLLVIFLLAVLYHWSPNVRPTRWRWISPGATLAVVVWVVASLAFGFYVSQFGSYNKTYGSLAGVIVFLLWLWITNNALLLGAQFNVELERVRELSSGMAAEEEILLPPRDTRNSEKAAAQLKEEVATLRAIRLKAARQDHTADVASDGRSAGSGGART